LTAGSEYLDKQIRSLKNRIGINGGNIFDSLPLATQFGRETVNIDISKKELPVWQVVSLLDKKGCTKRSIFDEPLSLGRGSIHTELVE